MNKRLSLVLRHAVYSLRGGFLVRPLCIAMALGLAGALFSWVEEAYPARFHWAPSIFFPSHDDPQVAQAVLSGIAGATMTVVSIVFAILLMTLTLASMQFSPRIIISFSRDRATQWTLGVYLGTFCYCMAALPAARTMPHPFSPVATVMGAMALALACVAWLLFFIHHVSHAISVNYIVERIASETEAVIDESMPSPHAPGQTPPAFDFSALKVDGAVLSDQSGYIRFADVERLLELARRYGVVVRVRRRVGHFVPAGIPFVQIVGADRLPPAAHDEFRSAFDIGPARTLQQDVEFGVLQIVDIALRAISPAVNDPSTAINCIDQLSRILIRFASRKLPPSLLYDLPGQVRVVMPWISFEGLLDSAFEQIRQYATTDVAVCLRLLRALGDISITTRDPDYRLALLKRGKRIVASSSLKLVEDDTTVMQLRLGALEKLSAELGAA